MSQNVLRMPRLSDSMSEATIVAWLKQPGETFLRGEGLVEVETDKATVVYEAEADGSLGEILVPEGGTAALGEPIARLGGTDGDGVSPEATVGAPARTTEAVQPVATSPVMVRTQPARGQRARATPVARRTAVQLGVSLHGLTGTGPGGRIRKQDVLRAGSAPPRAETSDLKGPTTRGRVVDDRRDDRPAHGAVPVRDPVVRRRHGGGHVDDRGSPKEPATSWRTFRR